MKEVHQFGFGTISEFDCKPHVDIRDYGISEKINGEKSMNSEVKDSSSNQGIHPSISTDLNLERSDIKNSN